MKDESMVTNHESMQEINDKLLVDMTDIKCVEEMLLQQESIVMGSCYRQVSMNVPSLRLQYVPSNEDSMRYFSH